MIELLDDPACTASAQKLLQRYAHESYGTIEAWRKWFAENRQRLFCPIATSSRIGASESLEAVRHNYRSVTISLFDSPISVLAHNFALKPCAGPS